MASAAGAGPVSSLASANRYSDYLIGTPDGSIENHTRLRDGSCAVVACHQPQGMIKRARSSPIPGGSPLSRVADDGMRLGWQPPESLVGVDAGCPSNERSSNRLYLANPVAPYAVPAARGVGPINAPMIPRNALPRFSVRNFSPPLVALAPHRPSLAADDHVHAGSGTGAYRRRPTRRSPPSAAHARRGLGCATSPCGVPRRRTAESPGNDAPFGAENGGTWERRRGAVEPGEASARRAGTKPGRATSALRASPAAIIRITRRGIRAA